MTSDEVLAYEGIRHTIANYTIAGDNRDAALFCALWTQDAVFEMDEFPPLAAFHCQGIEAIRGHCTAWIALPDKNPALRSATFIRHNLTTCRIELAGKELATAKTYFIVITDIGPDHAGTYTDSLIRQDMRWLLSHRKISLDWRSPHSCYPPTKRHPRRTRAAAQP